MAGTRNTSKTDRVTEIVTAAVIEALGGEANGLAAELAAEVINRKVPKDPYARRYGLGYGLISGGEVEEIPYLEYIARAETQKIAEEAVREWFKRRKADLKQQIIDSIDADAIAEDYLGALESALKEGSYSLTVNVEPRGKDDD